MKEVASKDSWTVAKWVALMEYSLMGFYWGMWKVDKMGKWMVPLSKDAMMAL